MMRKKAANSDKLRPSTVLKCVFMYHHSVADERCGRSCTLRSMGPGAGQSAGNRLMFGGCPDARTRDTYCENFPRRNNHEGASLAAHQSPQKRGGMRSREDALDRSSR